jgi:hypothetical protein
MVKNAHIVKIVFLVIYGTISHNVVLHSQLNVHLTQHGMANLVNATLDIFYKTTIVLNANQGINLMDCIAHEYKKLSVAQVPT